MGLRAAYDDFVRFAKPFPFGQNTPRFWGWAGGAGTADGVLASLLNAAFHSPNIIHHHAGTWIEMQVLEWLREAMGFPDGTKGNLTSGGSLANFSGLAVARHAKVGRSIRSKGLNGKRLTVYGSSGGPPGNDPRFLPPKDCRKEVVFTESLRVRGDPP